MRTPPGTLAAPTQPLTPAYPAHPSKLTGILAVAVVSLIVVVAVWRVAATYSVFSATMDEGVHLAAGIEPYQWGRYVIDLGHPPLARLAIGLPSYLAGVRLVEGLSSYPLGKYLLEEAGDYWTTLTLARAGNLIFLVPLIAYVYLWGARLYGRVAGLVAALLVSCSPAILGNAGLATTDLAAAASLTAAAFYLYGWALDPDSLPKALAASAAAALALMSKFSAVGFLPLIAIAFFLLAQGIDTKQRKMWNRRRLALFARRGLAAALVVFAVSWACYGFDTHPLHHPSRRPDLRVESILPAGSPLHTAASYILEEVPLPLQGYAAGLSLTSYHAAMGHGRLRSSGQFLLGEVSFEGGWWYYFPVALAVKSTLPLSALVLLAGIWLGTSSSRGERSRSMYPAVAALAVFGVGMASNLNVGIRHILPVYPFLAVFASSLFAVRDSRLRAPRSVLWVAALLTVGHVAASVHAHPDYLTYFNEIGRDREHLILSDGNLDWGQDLARLARHLDDKGIEDLHLSYFGLTTPSMLGIHGATPFGPGDRPTGWVAISISLLQGLHARAEGGTYDWLRRHSPVARIGKSIWLYHIDPAGDEERTQPEPNSSDPP